VPPANKRRRARLSDQRPNNSTSDVVTRCSLHIIQTNDKSRYDARNIHDHPARQLNAAFQLTYSILFGKERKGQTGKLRHNMESGRKPAGLALSTELTNSDCQSPSGQIPVDEPQQERKEGKKHMCINMEPLKFTSLSIEVRTKCV